MSSSKRHFTAVIEKKEQGSYVSSSPSSAARKAVSKLCADDKNRKVEFYIRETTQGSDKKVYGMYIGYVEKLKKPIELKGRIIKYKPILKLNRKSLMNGGAYIGNLTVNKYIRDIISTPKFDSDETLTFIIRNIRTNELTNYNNIRCLGEGTYGKVFLVLHP
jgi:hypothetical protein